MEIIVRDLRGFGNLEGLSPATLFIGKIGSMLNQPAEEEYDQLVAFLDELIDQVGEDENHPLASLMDVVGTLVEKYKDDHVPELTVDA
jgi:hypothetical protein